MDLNAVATGLATAAATIPGLSAFGYLPDSIPEPAFVITDMDIDFDRAFGRGLDQVVLRCPVLLGRADDKASQAKLNGYLSGGGAASLKAALEADGTLGGACDDLHVRRVSGRRYYQVGETQYVGAEFEVLVIGRGA
ncbi:MAG TPA: hypothetical protein VIS06_02650 [Mycobacteriales bacterium]